FFAILGPLSYKSAISSLKEQAQNHLISVREIKKGQIESYFSERKGDVCVLSKSPLIVEGLPKFIETFHSRGPTSPEYKQIEDTYGNELAYYVKQYGYHDLILTDTDGDIVFAAENKAYLGINVTQGGMEGSNIVQAFKAGMLRIELTDFAYYEPFNELTAFISAPVRDKAGKTIGVLIFQIPFRQVDRIMSERAGLGETGETYLVGEDMLMRSNSRFTTEVSALKLQVDTEAARDAMEGNDGVKIIRDYRNIPVLSAYGIINIENFFWAILCEIDASEAFKPAIRLRRWALLIGGSIIGGIAIYGYLIYRRFTNELTSQDSSLRTQDS
ncbi:MAG: cache domain-containing protein, partial [Candidatus Brocadiales bacterium]|nr:cache domain-containing protein [Candidatus Brocadiales bacterium]